MVTLTGYLPSKIAIPTSKGSEFIDIKEIVRIEADRSYSLIYLLNGRKLMVSRSLNEYDSMLSERNFFRIHHSHLINMEHVKMYVRGDGGYIEMYDTSVVPIARQRKEAFLESMHGFCL
ncbi:MAG TPA: LytTR family DNA-binding domain-containing protein [Bacteroidales bacterium]|jgi:two-component system LytT family response regulator|nr:LytTR family DNA-binding domain-containing protein [Bacteroidales bacterium]